MPTLRVVVRDCDAQALGEELDRAVASARPLLADALAVLDLRERSNDDPAPDALVEAVREAGVHLAAVMIADGNMRGALAGVGLPILEAPLPTSGRPAAAEQDGGTAEPEGADESHRGNTGDAAKSVTREPMRETHAPVCLTRPLRSGQRFYAQGRDLVVLAPTSQGSELIADGSIYAFSPLRGRTLAGASGDTGARIIATHLDAELVAIAGVYRTLEEEDIAALGGGTVSVALAFDNDGSERLVLWPV